MNKQIRNVGFISTRFQGTDGVSLETKKWVKVLKRMGLNCYFFAGQSDWEPQKTFIDEEAFFDHPKIKIIQEHSFNHTKRTSDLAEKIHKLRGSLKKSLYQFKNKFKIDVMIVENALSIPMNIPFGLALTEFIAETAIPTIGHHHDFAWERERFIVNCVNDYIKMAFPPSLPSVHHVCINSEAAHQLGYRRGQTSTIIPNVFDFFGKSRKKNEFTKSLRSDLGLKEDDLFFLQPTRIIARKGIEHSIELVHRLNNSKIKLVIAHLEKDEGASYLERILEYAKLLNVELIIRPDLIGNERKKLSNGKKVYKLWDFYEQCDFVCYPSLYEGFGNAFLEALYFKKPILLNRYAIYKRDIEPLGFDVITMDSYITQEIVDQVKKAIKRTDKNKKIAEKNFNIAARYFSFEVLEYKLKSILVSLF